MKAYAQSGFTIIETILFLSISSLLAVGLMFGVGTSINRERYHDSVRSLQSEIQQVYNDVINTHNSRDDNWKCDSSGVNKENGTATAIGQSDCFILGKYITPSKDGSSLNIKNVVGLSSPNITSSTNDIEALSESNIMIAGNLDEVYQIEWGAYLAQANSINPMSFSILILRSPSSGLIRTFTSNNNTTSESDIKNLLKQQFLLTPAKLCVDSKGLSNGPKMAIQINANATGTDSVEALGDDSGC